MPPRPPGPQPGAPALSRADSGRAATAGAPLTSRAALASALADLNARMGARIQPGRRMAEEVTGGLPVCPTGIPRLDEQLGGGFPRGRLSELCGPPSSGRTALATQLVAGTLARGALAAWIDPADAFDPASAVEAGIDEGALARLLWVRARSEREALRSCARILEAEGFELVLLDLVETTRSAAAEIPDASWLRLARAAASQRSALVVLSQAPRTGSRAELVIELRPLKARFSRPLALLDALETSAVLLRHRPRSGPRSGPRPGARPGEQPIALRLGAPEPDAPCTAAPRARP